MFQGETHLNFQEGIFLGGGDCYAPLRNSWMGQYPHECAIVYDNLRTLSNISIKNCSSNKFLFEVQLSTGCMYVQGVQGWDN